MMSDMTNTVSGSFDITLSRACTRQKENREKKAQ
jgi:hypothetical protein